MSRAARVRAERGFVEDEEAPHDGSEARSCSDMVRRIRGWWERGGQGSPASRTGKSAQALAEEKEAISALRAATCTTGDGWGVPGNE